MDINQLPGVELYELFLIYQTRRNINKHFTTFTIYQIAQELNFDLFERYKFLTTASNRKENFLVRQLKFQLHIIRQEEKSKDVYHLN
jgi:hypothetical protein